MAKAAKKEIKVKPKAKASQDTVKAVAFGVKVPTKKAKTVPKFKPGQRVLHQNLGTGEFKHYTNPTYEDAAVLFDGQSFETVVSVSLLSRVQGHKFKMGQSVAHKEGQVGIIVGLEYEFIRVKIDAATGETQKWLGADCTTVKKALAAQAKVQSKLKSKPKASGSSPSAEQVLKRRYSLKIGDQVRFSPTGDVGIIESVTFEDPGVSDQIRVSVKYPEFLESASVGPTLLTKIENTPKLRFGDVAVFSPFIVADSTFVKVGNSTAIAAQVRGSLDEPFAMLATPVAHLNKEAKRSFKQSDKVMPYSPTA
jgi:hypothetical protein